MAIETSDSDGIAPWCVLDRGHGIGKIGAVDNCEDVTWGCIGDAHRTIIAVMSYYRASFGYSSYCGEESETMPIPVKQLPVMR